METRCIRNPPRAAQLRGLRALTHRPTKPVLYHVDRTSYVALFCGTWNEHGETDLTDSERQKARWASEAAVLYLQPSPVDSGAR